MKKEREGATPPKFGQFLVLPISSHYSQVILLLGPWETQILYCTTQSV